MGDQILMWELRFAQLDSSHTRVELRTRKTLFDTYNRQSDMWQAVIACGGKDLSSA